MDKESNKASVIQPFPAMLRAVRRILYPLVHLLLKTGMTFPQLAELLKEVYIDVADKEFRLDNKNQTQTRLSFLTGVHRKDVKRLHNVSRDWEEPENVSVGVRLVAKWRREAFYQDDKGKPLKLPLKGIGSSKKGVKESKQSTPSFEQLVESVCKQDIRPRVILDEWLNLGIVTLNHDKRVQLITEAFIPRDGLDEKAFFVGHNVADHLSAASQNLLNDSPEFFERCVYYSDLSEESIAELKEMVTEQGMETLKILDQRAMELKVRDVANEGARQVKQDTENAVKQRINIGLYFYHKDEEESGN